MRVTIGVESLTGESIMAKVMWTVRFPTSLPIHHYATLDMVVP